MRRAVRLASRRHDVVALHVHDRQRDRSCPMSASSPSKTPRPANSSSSTPPTRDVRSRFAELAQSRRGQLRRALAGEGVDSLNLDTREPYEPALADVFQEP